MRTLCTLALLSSLAALLPSQELRRGLVDADAVVVARQVGRTAHSEELTLHRLQVLRAIRGAAGAEAVTVLDWPKLSLHQRPTPRQSRLYCLQDATATAQRAGLPADQGPYFRMVGWPGSNPQVDANDAADPVVAFAALLARADAGARGADTAAELCRIASEGDPRVRTEAARCLTERPDLRAQLSAVQWSTLLTRAGGEVEDVAHKIALAELCAEQRLEGVVDALLVSLGPVSDPEYARAVGRIGRLLQGEAVTATFSRRLQTLRDPKDRAALLLAMGASNTDSALDTLLRLQQNDAGDTAIAAALREHRGRRAQEAAGKRPK